MKSLIALFFLTISTLIFAHGGGYSSPEICSTTSTKSCAHVHFHEAPTSQEANTFIVHVEGAEESTVFTNIEVSLFMDMGNGHGHGSSPVVVTPADEENHFEISEAYFPMRGTWQVIVKFEDNGTTQIVKIPVPVKK